MDRLTDRNTFRFTITGLDAMNVKTYLKLDSNGWAKLTTNQAEAHIFAEHIYNGKSWFNVVSGEAEPDKYAGYYLSADWESGVGVWQQWKNASYWCCNGYGDMIALDFKTCGHRVTFNATNECLYCYTGYQRCQILKERVGCHSESIHDQSWCVKIKYSDNVPVMRMRLHQTPEHPNTLTDIEAAIEEMVGPQFGMKDVHATYLDEDGDPCLLSNRTFTDFLETAISTLPSPGCLETMFLKLTVSPKAGTAPIPPHNLSEAVGAMRAASLILGQEDDGGDGGSAVSQHSISSDGSWISPCADGSSESRCFLSNSLIKEVHSLDEDAIQTVLVKVADLHPNTSVVQGIGQVLQVRDVRVHPLEDWDLVEIDAGNGVPKLTVTGSHRIVIRIQRSAQTVQANSLQLGDTICCSRSERTVQGIRKFRKSVEVVEVTFKPDEAVEAFDSPSNAILSKGRPSTRRSKPLRQHRHTDAASIPDTEYGWQEWQDIANTGQETAAHAKDSPGAPPPNQLSGRSGIVASSEQAASEPIAAASAATAQDVEDDGGYIGGDAFDAARRSKALRDNTCTRMLPAFQTFNTDHFMAEEQGYELEP